MENQKNITARRRFQRRQLTRRILSFFVICLFLTLVNWYTSPDYWWVGWVAAGWGMGLLLSLIRYFTDYDPEGEYR